MRQQRGGELLRIVSYNNSCLTLKTSTTLWQLLEFVTGTGKGVFESAVLSVCLYAGRLWYCGRHWFGMLLEPVQRVCFAVGNCHTALLSKRLATRAPIKISNISFFVLFSFLFFLYWTSFSFYSHSKRRQNRYPDGWQRIRYLFAKNKASRFLHLKILYSSIYIPFWKRFSLIFFLKKFSRPHFSFYEIEIFITYKHVLFRSTQCSVYQTNIYLL